jgi:hypothetical protein
MPHAQPSPCPRSHPRACAFFSHSFFPYATPTQTHSRANPRSAPRLAPTPPPRLQSATSCHQFPASRLPLAPPSCLPAPPTLRYPRSPSAYSFSCEQLRRRRPDGRLAALRLSSCNSQARSCRRSVARGRCRRHHLTDDPCVAAVQIPIRRRLLLRDEGRWLPSPVDSVGATIVVLRAPTRTSSARMARVSTTRRGQLDQAEAPPGSRCGTEDMAAAGCPTPPLLLRPLWVIHRRPTFTTSNQKSGLIPLAFLPLFSFLSHSIW